jgi:Selenocysteine lyase
VHRGVYTLAEEATAAYEEARAKAARFIGAPSPRECIFTRSTTEAMNLVAHAWGRSSLKAGDAIVLTHMEHHANVVPWHMLAAERGVELRWIPLTPDGRLDLTDLDRLLDGVKLLGVTAVSNVLGTINDIASLSAAAHDAGALVLIDAAQAAPT